MGVLILVHMPATRLSMDTTEPGLHLLSHSPLQTPVTCPGFPCFGVTNYKVVREFTQHYANISNLLDADVW